MKFRLLIAVVTLFLLAAQNLSAAIVEDLYAVELAVADQTTSQRLEVFEQAFRDVIVKVSGSIEALNHPGMARPLKASSRYVHEFQYVTRQIDSEDSFDSGQLFLRVAFNQEAIENLLRENDISIWGMERPTTLLLLSYEINKTASIISSDTTAGIVEELDALARHQGLPVLFPLMDIEDRMLFGVQDIIANNNEKIALAAARYAPDVVLVGQISGQAGKGWQGKWRVQYSNQSFNWNYNASSHQEVMSQAIAQLAQALAKEYALESFASLDEDILFNVEQVSQLKDHIKLLSYLQSLDAIESVRLVLIAEDKLTYRVKLRNSTEDLTRLIALSNVLEQLELPQIQTSDESQSVIMNYRYIR